MTRYEKGFIEKCSEYGIDPRVLIKSAVGDKKEPLDEYISGAIGGGLSFGGGRAGLEIGRQAVDHNLEELAKSVRRSAGSKRMSDLPAKFRIKNKRAVLASSLASALLGSQVFGGIGAARAYIGNKADAGKSSLKAKLKRLLDFDKHGKG